MCSYLNVYITGYLNFRVVLISYEAYLNESNAEGTSEIMTTLDIHRGYFLSEFL